MSPLKIFGRAAPPHHLKMQNAAKYTGRQRSNHNTILVFIEAMWFLTGNGRKIRLLSAEWIHPDLIVIDQDMRFLNLLRRHLLDHLFLADRGIGITTNGGQHIPKIGAHQIGRGHSDADLVIPTDTRLRAGMTLHSAAKIPLKGADRVTLHPEAKRVHYADQLFSIRISRARRRPQSFARLGKFTGLHEITRLFDFRKNGARQKRQYHCKSAHLFLLLATPALAQTVPITQADFHAFDEDKARIGQLLFYDKILSGNRNISCATCHHPDLGTGDGLSLGIGEGGHGLGQNRTPGQGPDKIRKRIPRNAQALWNLGHRDIRVMFHDGRLEISNVYGNGFNSPAEEWLPEGLKTILAAQAIFPLVAQFEMAGNPKENEIAGAVHDRIDAAWPILAKRVRVIPEYGAMFVDAFDHIDTPEQVGITEIANALAAFMGLEWQSFDSPYDASLQGTALPDDAQRGADLFFGKAGCASCHSGPLFSDQDFHALMLPAFGPGRTRRFDPVARDVGRMAESDRLQDAYRFRTPMLRNVALTAPYGHNGAFPDLRSMIEHHLDPVQSNAKWTEATAQLPEVQWLASIDFVIRSDAREMARQASRLDITPVALQSTEIDDLIAFLENLTGATSQRPRFGIPTRVPSGLAVDQIR